VKLSIFIDTFLFSDHNIMKIMNDTEQINKLFKSQYGYTKEIVNKVKNFYFNDCNIECGTTRLENICHVSTSLVHRKPKRSNIIICSMNLFSHSYYNEI